MLCGSGTYEDDNGRHRSLALLGLSAENVRRMTEDREPIEVDGEPFGFDGYFLIFGGYATEDELRDELAQVIGRPESGTDGS